MIEGVGRFPTLFLFFLLGLVLGWNLMGLILGLIHSVNGDGWSNRITRVCDWGFVFVHSWFLFVERVECENTS
jgi:hypothetical protein